ncbi:carboxymuconolactone decarboxylase family protein [Pseudomonadota bacterium]
MTIEKLTKESAQGKSKEILEQIDGAFGMIPNVYGHMANSSNALGGHLAFDSEIKNGVLGAQLIEKISLAVSSLNECEYCKRAHFTVGKMNKVDPNELKKNIDGKSDDPKHQLAIDLALNVVSNKGKLTSEIRDSVKKGLSSKEIVEICAVALSTTFTNLFNHVAETEIDFPEIH